MASVELMNLVRELERRVAALEERDKIYDISAPQNMPAPLAALVTTDEGSNLWDGPKPRPTLTLPKAKN